MPGTFGMYFREVRTLTEREVRLIDYASRVAGFAIERSRSQVALQQAFEEIRKSEGQLRQITDAIPQTIVVLGPVHRVRRHDERGQQLRAGTRSRTRCIEPERPAPLHGHLAKHVLLRPERNEDGPAQLLTTVTLSSSSP